MLNLQNKVVLTITCESDMWLNLRPHFTEKNCSLLFAEDVSDARRLLAESPMDCLVVDLSYPGGGGLQLITEIQQEYPDLPITVVCEPDAMGLVAEALHLGAWDYTLKPIDDPAVFLYTIGKGIEKAQLLKISQKYRETLRTRNIYPASESIRRLNNRLHAVVESTKKLLGCGEIHESGRMILEEFAAHMDASGGSIYRVNEAELEWIASLDGGHALPNLTFPLPEASVFALALEKREAFIITDISEEAEIDPSGYQSYKDSSLVVFPLMDRAGEVSALVSMHNKKHPPFVGQDREIGAMLASYAGEALQTAKAIAALQRSEELMLQAQKMEAVGTLAGGIAHDFNNILSAIVGYTDLSLFSGGCDSKVRRNLEQVKKASRRARDLVHQILSISRVEEHREVPIDISAIIKEALKLLRASLPSSITVKKNIPTGLGLAKADPGRVHQVLMNLCTNAAHAMHNLEGVLSVEFSKVERAEEPFQLPEISTANCLKLTVSDTGTGMTPEVMARIFDPYFTTKKTGDGTGLGLAVAQGIIRGYGGAIRVESELGKGSCFTVYLPCIDDKKRKSKIPGAFVMPGGSEHILFVDDEETLAEMAGEMLKNLGYKVGVFTSSVEALKQFSLASEEYDLIITDQTMPFLSGLELTKEVIAIRADIPIILHTGYSSSIDGKEAKKNGISEFIKKPLSMTNLAVTVRKVLDGR